MYDLSDESRSLISPVAKRLALSHKSVSIRAIIEEIYADEIPESVENEMQQINQAVKIEREKLMKELYSHIWANITCTKEKRIRELKKSHDTVIETTTTYKPTQLPPNILLLLYQTALKTESGDIEINDVLQHSDIRPPEIKQREIPIGEA